MSRALDELRDLDAPLILYVGEGLPCAAGLPSRRQLVEALLVEAEDHLSAAQHRELVELARGPELPMVLSELERALTPASFGRRVERLLDDDAVEVPLLGRAIAGLRPRIRGVLTPNLDHLLERAFEGRLVVHAEPVADLASRTGWLLKLDGTLRDRSTWVLTQEQQARALHRDPLHRELFRSLLLSHPVLFVGTRLDEPGLVAILQQVQALAQGQPPRHWALVEADGAGAMRRRQLAAAGVELIGHGGEAEQLAMLESLAHAPSTAAAAPRASAPTMARPVPVTAEPSVRSVLLLAANPSGTDPLRLDRELRVIREAIERSHHRAALHLEMRLAATVHDLRRALLERSYDVVHISGHGEQEGLLLEDERGDAVQVSREVVARLLSRYAPPRGALRCVVLNACWSRTTGEEPSMAVPFTVAMDGPVSDRAALEFSRGFYDALGAGLGFPQAYEEGCISAELAAPENRLVAVLVTEADR